MTRDTPEILLKKIEKGERIARAPRWKKWWHRPLLYPSLLFFNYLIYPRIKRGISVWVRPFFGGKMKTILPSGTDIMLHSIKAHDSEIRLSKFISQQLQPGDHFIDIGAHYGYYTLMAAALVGPEGKVDAVEASSSSASILMQNTAPHSNISVWVAAASDHAGEVIFFEFPGPYAEYNTTAGQGYEGETWMKKVKRVENRVPTMIIDDLIHRQEIEKAVIKIDAEGGELAVLRGMPEALRTKSLTIVMEYLRTGAPASLHQQAVEWLQSFGFNPHFIDDHGRIHPLKHIDTYLLEKNLMSDNLVFIRRGAEE